MSALARATKRLFQAGKIDIAVINKLFDEGKLTQEEVKWILE